MKFVTDEGAEIVEKVVRQYAAEFIGAFTVIQPGSVRIRKLD